MQTQFHHHPDGIIYVRGDAGVYRADVATFSADASSLNLPAYEGLPEGYRERQYELGRHVLFTARSQFAGAAPWTDGDAYIAAHAALLELQAAREA